jgi:hypothetical protein
MGKLGIEELNLMDVNIPLFPVNYNLMNMCYLIIHQPQDLKRSHMSIIIDVGGNSPERFIIGLLVHLIANMNDGQCAHSTTLRNDFGEIDRSEVEAIYLGTQVKDVRQETAGSVVFRRFHGSSIPVNGSGDRIYPVSPGTGRNLSKPAAGYGHRILVSNSCHFPAGSERKRGVS